MWFIGVEVEQETSAPPPKKNPGSAPALLSTSLLYLQFHSLSLLSTLVIFRYYRHYFITSVFFKTLPSFICRKRLI